LGAVAIGVARGVTFTVVAYIVVAVIGEVVCSTVVTDTDGDLPGCWSGS